MGLAILGEWKLSVIIIWSELEEWARGGEEQGIEGGREAGRPTSASLSAWGEGGKGKGWGREEMVCLEKRFGSSRRVGGTNVGCNYSLTSLVRYFLLHSIVVFHLELVLQTS